MPIDRLYLQAQMELEQVLWEVNKTDQNTYFKILYLFYFSFNYKKNM